MILLANLLDHMIQFMNSEIFSPKENKGRLFGGKELHPARKQHFEGIVQLMTCCKRSAFDINRLLQLFHYYSNLDLPHLLCALHTGQFLFAVYLMNLNPPWGLRA